MQCVMYVLLLFYKVCHVLLLLHQEDLKKLSIKIVGIVHIKNGSC